MLQDSRFSVFSCDHVGVSTTTNIYIRQVQTSKIGEEIWEARAGIAIMGYTNNENKISNPFDPRWRDNFVRGFGTSQEKAKEALIRDARDISQSLFA